MKNNGHKDCCPVDPDHLDNVGLYMLLVTKAETVNSTYPEKFLNLQYAQKFSEDAVFILKIALSVSDVK